MSDTNERAYVAPDARRLLAFDVPRTWANSVQVIPMPRDFAVIFREQFSVDMVNADDVDAGPEHQAPTRNVASVLIPREVAREMAKIVLRLDEATPDTAENASEPPADHIKVDETGGDA